LLSDYFCPIQNRNIDFAFMTIHGQSLRESIGQFIPNIDGLNAALLEQPAARSALGSPRDFAPVNHYICVYGVVETTAASIADAGPRSPYDHTA
jgi:hypothetical protein